LSLAEAAAVSPRQSLIRMRILTPGPFGPGADIS
jgi:hypothetical protein